MTKATEAQGAALTSFSVDLDNLARSKGWPTDAVVYSMEAIGEIKNGEDNCFVILCGAVPIGLRPDGRPLYAKEKERREFKTVVTLREYRAALSAACPSHREEG